jgi:hypothetical protein
MNNRLFKAAGICASAVFILSSCSDIAKMQIPETVSVKTNATYSANFGTYSKKLSDFISAATLAQQIAGANSSFSVYDYNPGNAADCQEFLIKYPVLNKTIDVASSLAGIDLTSAGISASINQTFAIPDLSKSFTQDLSLSSLNTQIAGQTSIGTIPDITVVDPGNTTIAAVIPDLNVTISSPTFSTITYRTGSLDIAVTAPAGTTLTDLTLTAALKNGTTDATISTSAPVNVSSGGTISIPLTGKTLVPSLKISLSGTIKGTSAFTSHSYSITPSVSSADISQVTGLTMTNTELGASGTKSISTSVDLSNTAPLTTAKIGTGSLSVQCAMPSGWSGITASASGFALSGALTSSSFTDNGGSSYLLNQSLNLAGKTFTPGTLTVSGTIELSLNNATLTFPSGGTTITTTASCAISTLETATIDTSGYTLSQTYSSAVPGTLASFVNAIYYSKAGVKVASYTNTLPAGNNIGLTLTSSFLNISGTDAQGTINSNTTAGTLELAKTGTDVPINVSSATSVDTTVAITLPYANGSTATFNNLATGTSYTLSASGFTAELDWTRINVNTSSLAVSDTTGTDLGINFDTILSSLPASAKTALNTVHIDSLPVYLSVEMPNLAALNTLSLSGNIYLQYPVSGTPTNSDILGVSGTSTAGTLSPQNITLAQTNNVVTTDLAASGLTPINLASVFNARPSSIKLFYTIAPAGGSSGVDITYADYQAIQTSGVNIAATVYIVLPLKATFTADTTLDIMSLAGKTAADDLLGRTAALSTTDYQKYLDAIKDITLSVSVGDLMGLSGSSITITDNSNIFNSTGTTINLSGTSSFSLSGTQISSVLTTYPYMPTVTLTIPNNTKFVVPREADLSVNLSANVTTDGTIKVYGGNN